MVRAVKGVGGGMMRVLLLFELGLDSYPGLGSVPKLIEAGLLC